jgi:S-adenosylmethionine/arginine decarboxylase-like enzyme
MRFAKTRKTKDAKDVKANKKSWGYHLIVDAADCNPDAIRSASEIKAFVKKLVKDIDMIAYGPPKVVMFGEDNKKGYTLVQLIETSNITAHFVEETNDIYLDIFSCKSFNPSIALSTIRQFFSPKKMNTHFLKRQAPAH